MMDAATRRALLDSYGQAYTALAEAVARFPRTMWQHRAPDGWTIHEIIIHITDSEANSYVRCRRFIAEPGQTVLGYDENKWAIDLHYHDQSPDDAIELFRLLRQASYRLVRNLPDSVWANTVHHTENGLMTMDDWLITYERHVRDHVAQMQTVYDHWLETTRSA